MSYIDELKSVRTVERGELLHKACAEVDRMRERESKHAEKYLAEHADLRARLAVADAALAAARGLVEFLNKPLPINSRTALVERCYQVQLICETIPAHENQTKTAIALSELVTAIREAGGRDETLADLAKAREELADLKLVREGCKEVAADVIKAVERRYGDGFGVPANLKTEIITIIAANLWTGHTDAEKFATEQALAALREDRERIMQSYEYCVNRSLKHIADKKPTLAVCVLEARQKSLNEKRAEMQAALHPATKEGNAP